MKKNFLLFLYLSYAFCPILVCNIISNLNFFKKINLCFIIKNNYLTKIDSIFKKTEYYSVTETQSERSSLIKSIIYMKNSIECLRECNKNQNCTIISLPFKSNNSCNLYMNGLIVKLNKSYESLYFFKKQNQQSGNLPWTEYYERILVDVVSSLTLLPNKIFLSTTISGEINIWDQNETKIIQTLNVGISGYIRGIAILKNGYLAAGVSDFSIKIFNLTNQSLCMKLDGHTDAIFSMVTLENGNLASGSLDSKIKIWNVNNGAEIITLSGHTGQVYSLTLLDNGDLISGSIDKNIIIWDKNNYNLKKIIQSGHSLTIRVLLNLENNLFASGSFDETIKIWNVTNGALIKTLYGNTDRVISLALLPNGLLASGCSDHLINIWNISTGKIVKSLNEHTGQINSLILLENGELASGSADNTIKIWKISN